MQYANRIMSEDMIKAWIEQYIPVLYCKKDYYKACDKGKCKAQDYMYLYPHEFLFLICNSVPRDKFVYLIII